MNKLLIHFIKYVILCFNNLINSLYSLFQIALNISMKPSLKEIVIDFHKSLIVMGNGPSLNDYLKVNKIDLTNNDICVVNDFAFSNNFLELRPKYYFFVDDMYWMEANNTHEVAISNRTRLFKELNNKTIWPLKIFVPSNIFKKNYFQKIFEKNRNIMVYPLNKYPFNGYNSLKYYLYRNNLSMPQVQNVLVASLFVGINLGYRNILLIGAENNWTEFLRVDSNNQVCITNRHFYDGSDEALIPFLKGTGEVYRMHEILTDLSKTFLGYIEVNKYAEKVGAKIINLSKHSFIDAFNRG